MALREGEIEFDGPLTTIEFDEESIEVTSNNQIEIESGSGINVGRTVPYALC